DRGAGRIRLVRRKDFVEPEPLPLRRVVDDLADVEVMLDVAAEGWIRDVPGGVLHEGGRTVDIAVRWRVADAQLGELLRRIEELDVTEGDVLTGIEIVRHALELVALVIGEPAAVGFDAVVRVAGAAEDFDVSDEHAPF